MSDKRFVDTNVLIYAHDSMKNTCFSFGTGKLVVGIDILNPFE
jgi:hypothetical protein